MAPTYSPDQVRAAILDLLRANEFHEDVYVQPLVYFAEGIPGYLSALDRPSRSELMEVKGVTACISSWLRLADNVMPPRAKALANYQNSRFASTEARINGYDFSIMLNQQGKVAEASHACLFIVRDGVAITPPWSAGTLESITRQVLITLLRDELGVAVQERDIDRTELYVADEVLLCGTGRGAPSCDLG